MPGVDSAVGRAGHDELVVAGDDHTDIAASQTTDDEGATPVAAGPLR